MNDEAPKQEEKRRSDPKLNLVLFQAAICLIIVAVLFVIKLIGGGLYTGVRTWYIANFEDTTSMGEVLDPDSSDRASGNESGEEPPESTPQDAETDPVSSEPDEENTETGQQPQENAFDLNAVQTVKNTRATSKNALVWPVNGIITSGYGDRTDPFGSGKTVHHYGMDIAAVTGTPVGAAMDGVVSAVGCDADGYGNYVILLHQNGFYTLYGHCSAVNVKKGQSVSAGEEIAQVGSTGAATGPHLHFEIRVGGQKLNPAWILNLEENT